MEYDSIVALTVTVDLLVGSITSNPGVKEPRAATAFEALLVPHLTLGKNLQKINLTNKIQEAL